MKRKCRKRGVIRDGYIRSGYQNRDSIPCVNISMPSGSGLAPVRYTKQLD